jgi:hypothetical protein
MRQHGHQHQRVTRGACRAAVAALVCPMVCAMVGTLVGVVSACSPAGDAAPAGAAGTSGPTAPGTTSGPGERPGSGPSTQAPDPRPSALVDVPVRAATPPPRPRVDAPARLRVADRDIALDIVPVGVAEDGSMELPAAADVAGWYRYGPAPGSASGNAVLAAHVDSAVTGLGPLVGLRDVEEGSRLTVRTASGRTLVYSVTGVDQVPKTDAPLRAWFERDGPPQLVVITCGGAWDADIGHYSDNVVLTAEPVGR